MSFLLDQTGYGIHRNRRVVGGTTLKPGPALTSIVRNRNVPSGATIGKWIGIDPLEAFSITRLRNVRGGALTYTSGENEGEGSGGDTGDPGQLSWYVDAAGNARLTSLALGSMTTADTKIISRGTGKVGLDTGDSFVVGTGVRLDAGDYVEFPETADLPLETPTRKQAKLFKGSASSVAISLDSNIADNSTVLVAVFTTTTGATNPTHTTPTNWSADKTEDQSTSAGKQRLTIFRRKYATGGAFSETFQWGTPTVATYRVLVVEVDKLLTSSPVEETSSSEGATPQAWSHVGTSGAYDDYSGQEQRTLTIYKPSGVQDGDLMLIAVKLYNDYGQPTISLANWTQRVNYTSVGYERTSIFERVASSEPSSYTITIGWYSGTTYVQAAWVVWRTVGTFDAAASTYDNAPPYVGSTSLTMTDTNGLGVYIAGNTVTSGGQVWTPNTTGLTERYDDSDKESLFVGDIPTVAGPIGTGWSVSMTTSTTTSLIEMAYRAVSGTNALTAASGTTGALDQAKEYCFSVMGASAVSNVTGVTGPTGGFSNIAIGDFVSEAAVLLGQDKIASDTSAVSTSRQVTADSIQAWIGAVVTYKSETIGSLTPPANTVRLQALEADDTYSDLVLLRPNGDQIFLGNTVPPGLVVKVKQSDESVTSSTTPQNDDELYFPIGANEDWVFRFHIFYGGSTTGDIRLWVAGPSGSTVDWAMHPEWDETGTVSVSIQSLDGTAPGPAAFGTSAGQAGVALILGTIMNGATAGNVYFQWAQRTSDGTATTVKAMSSMHAQRVT